MSSNKRNRRPQEESKGHPSERQNKSHHDIDHSHAMMRDNLRQLYSQLAEEDGSFTHAKLLAAVYVYYQDDK